MLFEKIHNMFFKTPFSQNFLFYMCKIPLKLLIKENNALLYKNNCKNNQNVHAYVLRLLHDLQLFFIQFPSIFDVINGLTFLKKYVNYMHHIFSFSSCFIFLIYIYFFSLLFSIAQIYNIVTCIFLVLYFSFLYSL